MLKRPKVLIFDEATTGLDQNTAERFAQTANKLRGKATVIFISHQLPKGLAVDVVETIKDERITSMQVVDDHQ